jgi:hypothetical protein
MAAASFAAYRAAAVSPKYAAPASTLVAFASASLLLMTALRSKFVTPNSFYGWRSIMVTTQLSGVRSPFLLRLERAGSAMKLTP